jgi:photosystem II stability/assembly factor-like uncharacterized protein
LLDIRFVDAQQGWIVGGAGTVLSTLDGGLSWQRQATGTAGSAALQTMFWLDGESGWVGGSFATILATATGGR